MASNELERLVIMMEANTERMRREFAKSQKKLTGFEKRVAVMQRRLKKQFAKMGRSAKILSKNLAVGLAAGATAAGAGIALMVKRSLTAVDRIGKMSAALGFSTETLGAWRHVAQQTGLDLDKIEKAAKNLQVRLVEADRGVQTYARAFDTLGINTKRLLKMSPDQQLIEVVEAMQKIENQAARTNAAYQLFGGRGVGLLAVKNLRALTAEAESFGLALSAGAVRGVEAANDAWGRLKSLFTGISDNVTAAFAPSLQALADFITGELMTSIKESGGSVEMWALNIAQSVLEAIKKISIGISDMIKTASAEMKALGLIDESEIEKNRRLVEELIADRDRLDSEAAVKRASGDPFAESISAYLTKRADGVQDKINLILQQFPEMAEESGEAAGGAFTRGLDKMIAALEERRAALLSGKPDGVALPTAAPLAIGADDDSGGTSIAEISEVERLIKSMNREADILLAKDPFSKVLAGLDASITEEQEQRLRSAVMRVNDLKKAQEQQGEAAARAAEKVRDAQEKARRSSEMWQQAFANSFADMIFQARSLGDVLNSLARRFASMMLFGASGTGGLFGSLFGGVSNFFGGLFGGARADGGPVSAGTSYLVGERGPEIFTARKSGTIIPNQALAGAGGARAVTVNQTIRFDVGLESVDTRIAQAAAPIAQAAKAATLDVIQRGY